MKAAILVEQGKPLEMWDLTVPELLDGQVLVNVKVAGICGAQMREMNGDKGPDPYLPHLLGHEGAGVVEAVGPGAWHVRPGDRVVMHWRKNPSGVEAAPPKYYPTDRKDPVGAGPVATWAEQAVVSENRLTRIPDDVPFDVAALLGCGVTTGLGIVNNEAKVQPGESVLVIGVGGVGLNVVQGAILAGANVEVVDINQNRLKLAQEIGARQPIGFVVRNSVDVAVECTGIPEMIRNAILAIKPGGRVILVGQPKAGASITLDNFSEFYQGKTIMDSQGGKTDPSIDIPRCVDLWRSGALKLEGIIGPRFPLWEVWDAVKAHQVGVPGRVLLEME